MKFGKLHIVVTYGLLLYFVCFIVPPVSSILPSSVLLADAKNIAVIGKDNARERMYLYDLTLWEILKRAKRSDQVTAVRPQGSEGRHQSVASQNCIVDHDPCALPLLKATVYDTPHVVIHSLTGFPFSFSGLSPPALA